MCRRSWLQAKRKPTGLWNWFIPVLLMGQRTPSCSYTCNHEYEATSLFYLKKFRFVSFSPSKHKSSAISVHNERDPSRNNIQQLRKQLMEFVYTAGQTFSVRKFCIQLTLFPPFLPFVHLLISAIPRATKKTDDHQQPQDPQAIWE